VSMSRDNCRSCEEAAHETVKTEGMLKTWLPATTPMRTARSCGEDPANGYICGARGERGVAGEVQALILTMTKARKWRSRIKE